MLRCRIEFGIEPAQSSLDDHFIAMCELRRTKEGLCPGVLDGTAYGKVLGEEGVDLGRRLPNACLDVEDGYPGLAGLR